ncbi:MAG: hypothetical protein O7G84_13560 [Gammaproteobacteria bacterium]|nr:hypothetical protein [Gammaproteobacteria bacterium]
MRYAAVHGTWLGSDPAALDATDAALGAWLRLQVLASEMELGEGGEDLGEGRIPSCAEWSDRAWLRAVGTDRAAVDTVVAAKLARWDGNDLLVGGYDRKGQAAIEAKREGGKKGGRPRNNHSKTSPKPKKNHSGTKEEPDEKVTKTSSKPPSFPSPSFPSLSPPSREGANDSLESFASSWHELTHRSDFAEFVNGCGQLSGTHQQVLTDFRKACGGSVAEFRARVSARLAEDTNGFLLKQKLLHWADGPIHAPVTAPNPGRSSAPVAYVAPPPPSPAEQEAAQVAARGALAALRGNK